MFKEQKQSHGILYHFCYVTVPHWLISSTAIFTLVGCTKFDLLNCTIPHAGYVCTRDIAYGVNPRQKLDVYVPNRIDKPLGTVIFFYGGNWQTGSKSDYFFVAQALAAKGYIAVLPDYRLYPEVQFPGFVDDGALATKWAHDHVHEWGGDASKIHLMGHSAGAYIAAMLALDGRYLKNVGMDRSDIKSAALLSGPYDFYLDVPDRPVFGLQAGEIRPQLQAQPITYVDGKQPPLLLIHGLDDRVVALENTTHLTQRIHEQGGIVHTILYPKKDHVAVCLSIAWSFRWLAPTLDDTIKFFDSTGSTTQQSVHQ